MKVRPKNCHDCNCREGELHHYDCDMERCPFCGGQLIICDCCYKLLNIDAPPGTWAYKHGLTDEQEKQWIRMLEEKGRIPWLSVPNLCGLCGEQWPEMFGVPDEEWKKFVIPRLRGKILCRRCYDRMKELFPNGWKAVSYRKRLVPKQVVLHT